MNRILPLRISQLPKWNFNVVTQILHFDVQHALRRRHGGNGFVEDQTSALPPFHIAFDGHGFQHFVLAGTVQNLA